jgi:hypothetical protein
MQRAALDALVDHADQRAVLGVGGRIVAAGDGGLETTEVRLDRRGVAAVLKPLTLGALNALLLGCDVGHDVQRPRNFGRGGA